jgi:hypothetical protein
LPKRVVDELQTNARHIKAAMSAAWLWERVLTERERQSLGGDLVAAWRRYGTAGMWIQLRGVSAERAVVDVPHALGLITDGTWRWLLRELGEVHDDPEEALQAAVAGGGLVLVEHTRAVYWQGKELAVAWEKHSALWGFFWEVCRQAKAGQAVDHTTLGSTDVSVVAKQKSRLLGTKGFPRALGDLIKPAGRYTQKLDLPREQIRIFETVVNETLRERTG